MSAIPEPVGSMLYCTECGRPHSSEDLARFGQNLVCADCKPRFLQQLREGSLARGSVVYGGFWQRFAAFVLDAIILSVVVFPVQMLLGANVQFGGRLARSGQDPATVVGTMLAITGLIMLVSVAMNCAYYGYFLSQKGATPGKMVLGLKVTTADGGPLSVPRAIGRYFAYFLDSIILCIGFIIIAFDSEKRALHDHICSTRVVRSA